MLVYNGTARGEAQPYGADALEDLGYTLTHPRTVAVPSKLREVAHHRFGVRVDRPGLVEASRADLVLAYLEPNIGLPALLRRAAVGPHARLPLAGIFCWAAEDLQSGSEEHRRRVSRMLRACDVVGYFSSNQADVLVSGGAAREALALLPFGVDTAYFSARSPQDARDIDVLSVGWDRGRDYATLARAVRGTGVSVSVVAPRDRFGEIEDTPELRVLGTVPREDYRDLLARSRVVVVPTHELAYPTGQSVALEAAAAGCAMVVTGSEAMSDYFSHGVTAEMPPPGDPDALGHAISSLLADDTRRRDIAARGRAHVLERYDERHLWQALDTHLRDRGLLPDR